MAKKKGVISPANYNIFPGLSVKFSLTGGGKPLAANWRLSQPKIGTLNAKTGEFKAAKDFTFGASDIIAESDEYVATAKICVMVGRGLSENGPLLADGYWGLDCLPWNDSRGKRGAKLIFDAIDQLPRKFLELVDSVAIVRVNRPSWSPEGLRGMHLPLPKRVVLLTDAIFQELPKRHPEITKADVDFVQTLVHELSHVVLANEGLPDWKRWVAILELIACISLAGAALAAGTLTGPAAALIARIGGPALLNAVAARIATGSIAVISLPALVLLQYYWPFPQEDLAFRFAKVAGWRIRNPNPLAWIGCAPELATPNAITGFGFVGSLVGLRNIYKPGRDGAVSSYARTDVHEDFAETVASLALGYSADEDLGKLSDPLPPGTIPSPRIQDLLSKSSRFKARRDLLNAEGIWPKKAPFIDVGSTVLKYARSLTSGPKPSFDDFGVFLGLYAGKTGPSKPAAKSVVSVAAEAKPSPASGRMTSKSRKGLDTAELDAPDDGGGDSGSGAEGYGKDWDRDDIESAVRTATGLEGLDLGTSFFQEYAQPTVDRVAETLRQLEQPGSLETTYDLMASASCHGSGLRRVSLADKPADIQEEDILFSDDALPWVVKKVEQGVVTQVIGAPKPDPEKKLDDLDLVLDPARVVLHWRPAAALRRWYEGQSHDEAVAYTKVVRIWGLDESDEFVLNRPGSFLAEVFGRMGRNVEEIAGLGDADLKGYCQSHGGLQEPTGLKSNDVVRLKGGLWAYALSTDPLCLLIQGGGKGLLNEEKEAVKLLIGCDPQFVLQRWQP